MNKHIAKIAAQNRILILGNKEVKRLFPKVEAKFLTGFGSCALRGIRAVYLQPTGHKRNDYMVALHELGHILNPLRGWKTKQASYKARIKDEQLAWEWALANAWPRPRSGDYAVALESFMCHVLAPELDEVMACMRELAAIRQNLDFLSQFPDSRYKLLETVKLEIRMDACEDRMRKALQMEPI